jgi:hypothetical protein
MAGTGMTDPYHDPHGDDLVDDYLAAITAQLPGPATARAAIAEELRDGLLETRHAHLARGRSDREASAAAIAEFGDPRAVAAAFGLELAAAQARRVARNLLATGPLVGLSWIAAAAVNAFPPWRHQLTGPWLALPVVGLALLTAGPALGVTMTTTGRSATLGSRADQQASSALTAVAVAALAAATADLTLLAMLAGHALTAPGPLRWVGVAVAASLTRGVLAGRAARRCLGVRAALP